MIKLNWSCFIIIIITLSVIHFGVAIFIIYPRILKTSRVTLHRQPVAVGKRVAYGRDVVRDVRFQVPTAVHRLKTPVYTATSTISSSIRRICRCNRCCDYSCRGTSHILFIRRMVLFCMTEEKQTSKAHDTFVTTKTRITFYLLKKCTFQKYIQKYVQMFIKISITVSSASYIGTITLREFMSPLLLQLVICLYPKLPL